MDDSSKLVALRARFVFPVSGEPIDGGVVTIRDGRVESVGRDSNQPNVRDLGNLAILPGLVNAHTHLEFSDLTAPLGASGMDFPDWIRWVVAYRRSQQDGGRAAIRAGLDECLATGTACLGEIATRDWRTDPEARFTLPQTVMFYELIGPRQEHVAPALANAAAFLSAAFDDERILPALSPHAPYTVHAQLLAGLVEMAREGRVPLAMHLAESHEEMELLHTGGGLFREVLRAADAWDPSPEARHQNALGYLEQLAQAPRALAIHGNYLSRAERELLVQHANTMALVYCPRTHAFFRHDPYPLAEMLAQGVPLALGTDSRASNPDLNFFEEMRFVAANHPAVPPRQILELGTLSGAKALGLSHRFGTIGPGKSARLAVVQLPESNARDPHELLFDPGVKIEPLPRFERE